jgi:hypothetical protein
MRGAFGSMVRDEFASEAQPHHFAFGEERQVVEQWLNGFQEVESIS